MPARPDGTEPVIAHGSVYLRAAERDDIPRFVAWLNDYRTSRTLGLRAPLSIPIEEAWFERMVADQGKGGYLFTACLLADDRPIGDVCLIDLDLVNGSAGLGILIGEPGDRGRGHGTDMLEALVGFGFASLRLERIWLDVYDFNPGARRVYERVGFQHEGVLRHAFFREAGSWTRTGCRSSRASGGHGTGRARTRARTGTRRADLAPAAHVAELDARVRDWPQH
jgi:RimJ/RimL family protein N-acetyltransferase